MKPLFLPPTIQRDMLLTRLAGEYHRQTGEHPADALFSVEIVLSQAVIDYVLKGAEHGLSPDGFWSWLEESVQHPNSAFTSPSA